MINPQPVNSNYSPYKAGSTITDARLTGKPNRPWKKGLLWTLIFLFAAGGTFVYAEYRSVKSNTIVSGEGNSNGLLGYNANLANSVDWSKFQTPGDGRFNVLVLGIGGTNDQGQAHAGTLLTDSIQVVSLDTVNKKVSITSVPRDFYYVIPGVGPSKINAVYSNAESRQAGSGGAAARTAIGKVLGITISNFVTIDFTAAQEAVDEVGGVDVTVPSALYDPSYPCEDQINYCPFSISAGTHHLNGATALKYMRTRHADSDFGRSARQQAVISALKAKALSLGTLSNPVTVNNLIQTFSKHIKTDMQPGEIQSFISIYKGVAATNTTNSVLSTDAKQGLLASANLQYTGDVEYPIPGYSNYIQIHEWYALQAPDPFVSKEAATITVAGSTHATDKQLQSFVQGLKDYGFNITLSTILPHVIPTVTTIYSSSSDKPVSENYLRSVTGASVSSGTPLNSGTNFEIVYVPVSQSVPVSYTP